jgi:transposase
VPRPFRPDEHSVQRAAQDGPDLLPVRGSSVTVIPAWLVEPLWVQVSALLPERPTFDPGHPLGVHRRRLNDRIVFDKLIQVLRFGCSYQAIADTTCSATTIRNRRDEWITLGVFAQLKRIVLECYDRIVGLVLEETHRGPHGRQPPGASMSSRRGRGNQPTGAHEAAGARGAAGIRPASWTGSRRTVRSSAAPHGRGPGRGRPRPCGRSGRPWATAEPRAPRT